MANWQWFTKLHRAIYRATGGRLGANMGGIPMLLLTTTGWKSGEPRTVPLACVPHGDALVVVGSNDGREFDPAWWRNLQKSPEAEVRYGRERRRVRAQLATPEERRQLWPILTERNPHWARYEETTQRAIPVVLLRTIRS